MSDESNCNSLGMSSSMTVPFVLEIYLIIDISNVSYDRAFLARTVCISRRTTIDNKSNRKLIAFHYSALIDLTWEECTNHLWMGNRKSITVTVYVGLSKVIPCSLTYGQEMLFISTTFLNYPHMASRVHHIRIFELRIGIPPIR